MSAQTVEVELVVSSWPFRTGVVVYDPLRRVDVADWDLSVLAEGRRDVLHRLEPALNPLRGYRGRAELIVQLIADERQMLRDALAVTDPDCELEPRLSDDMELLLAQFASEHDVPVSEFALLRLPQLLARLGQLPAVDHHRFCADWWETFERPAGSEGPSAFRADGGPGGAVYANVYHEAATARQMWESDVASTPLNRFSLWTALRTHWAWRLEFSDAPEPSFPVFGQLAEVFDLSVHGQ